MKQKLLIILLAFFSLNAFSQSIDVNEIELNFYGNSNPHNFAKGINKIYFIADDGINGQELWTYDKISNSTYLVKDINNGSNGIDNSIFLTIDDILYFTINVGTELWRSDGTESGTYLVKHINSNSWSSNTIKQLLNYNGNIVFSANDDVYGQELWISDGTTNGTILLKDIKIGSGSSSPENLFVFNGMLFFTANDGINGREIWKSDGTNSGTILLKNIDSTNSDSIWGGKFIILNNSFYFYANNTINGYELWKSDGTETGTQLFKDINVGNGSSNFSLIGAGTSNYFIFEVDSSTLGTELWKCDGTIAGTILLKDINPGTYGSVSSDTQFAVLNNSIYFDGYTNAKGYELWGTNGSVAGTQLIKDINTGASGSNITALTSTTNSLIFSAQSNIHNYNTLWKSDGTTLGTVELKDTNLTQYSNYILSFTEFNNKVFFPSGYNSINGIELWATDGTSLNTGIFKDIFHLYAGIKPDFYDVAQLGNKLIFTGNNGNGYEPFITDGTINGSHEIKNLLPGNFSIYSSDGFRPACYTKAGNFVFFRAGTSDYGYELWKTDGTEANTSMVKDINIGTGNSISEYPLFMEYNGILYFKADDGIHGEELWRSDGTDVGTYMVKDINPGNGYAFNGQSNVYYNSPVSENERCYAVLNGYLYFFASDSNDNSLWRTDGTQSGTIKVVVIPSGGVYDNLRLIINASNNKIFFKTNTTNSSYGNNSLWSTDGTQAGTTLLYHTDITGPIQYKKNIIHNNNLYFSVYGSNGNALVKSDGTVGGTITVIENFTTQDTFNSLSSCGNYVYFGLGSQGSSYYSKELWRTDGTTIGTVKLGEFDISDTQSFIQCTACHQENLIFKKDDYNDDKIYYVNGNSTNADNYLTTNIVNSENFGEIGYYIYSDFYDLNNTLLFTGAKEYGGYELYSSNFNFTLNNESSENSTIKNDFVLYPNPTNNIINFKTNNTDIVLRATIYNLLGETIFSSDIINNKLQLFNINDGIYIINVTTDKSQYNCKLVIKK